jgi:hypothetical protein
MDPAAPIECMALMLHPWCSLERNERGEWEATTAVETLLMQTWYKTNPKHFVQTWLSMSACKHTKYSVWLETTNRIQSHGIPLFAHVSASMMYLIVESHAHRPGVATRMFTYMLQRYTKKCHKILSMFTRFGEEIVLNLVAARPEWFDEPESRDFIVSFCVRNNLSLML